MSRTGNRGPIAEPLIKRNLHWLVVDGAAGYLVAAVVCALCPIPVLAPLIFLACGGFVAAYNLAQAYAASIVISEKAVRISRGIIWKYHAHIPLEHVESVYVVQSPIERVMGCGSLHITGLGGREFSFGPVRDPEEIQEAIYSEKTEVRGLN